MKFAINTAGKRLLLEPDSVAFTLRGVPQDKAVPQKPWILIPIERPLISSDNCRMSTDTSTPPNLEEADSKAVLAHAFKGKPLDPEVEKRVHERAEKVRAELRQRGVTNFTADLLRECRDE